MTDREVAKAYLNNPEAQERVQDLLDQEQKESALKLKKEFNVGTATSTLEGMVHLLGEGGARTYIKLAQKYKSEEIADQIMAYGDPREPQITPRGGPDSARPNKYVSVYANEFQKAYDEAVQQQQSSTPAKVDTPKVEKKLPVKTENINPEPTFTASPYKQPVDKEKTKVEVPNEKEEAIETERPYFTLPDIEVNWKTSASVGKWLYEAFGGDDEDKKNVFEYLEKGGTLSDVWDMFRSYQAKKNGSEGSDLIGTSKSISPALSADRVIINWGTDLNKSTENLVKKKYVVDDKLISSSPSIIEDKYTSNSFAINLKSDSANKFGILDNIHSGSNVGNINNFYKSFTPVDGSVVFTIQNDIVTRGEKPLTTIKKGDTWYKNTEEVIKLDNGKIEIVKTKDIKEGDQVFKLKDKIFSFDDFDIKDGKINTVYDTNIGYLIPKVKSDSKVHKGKSFTIGLTDTKKTPGYISLDETTQYGKSRGGSFILFSEDLDQQYMIGGSFKNLYDFYQKVQNAYPDKKFKVFASDTGSYSYSIFPKDGKIDGDVYRKTNNRNSWGDVQHLILKN